MRIVKFKGGLGNQLFQYAFLRCLELNYKCEDVKSDLTYYGNVGDDNVRKPRIEHLNVLLNQASKNDIQNVCKFKHDSNPTTLKYKIKLFIEKTINDKYYFEENRSYRNPHEILEHKYFDGYWQSWKYLQGIEKKLISEIGPKTELSTKTRNTIKILENENAVFLGVRRGDYLQSNRTKNHFGSFGQEYFEKAIQIIKGKVDNPVLYVFSNDIEWVKENLKFECKTVYREKNDQVNDVEELFIMAACKHAIIVNSTYYWWGAWLIKNENKIIVAPKNWFVDGSPIDIVPEGWIKI